MAKLLYIQASPRINRSFSIRVADVFEQTYHSKNPSDEVEILNLFHMNLPEMDQQTIQGKYNIIHQMEYTELQKLKWASVEEIIDLFSSADKYLFAVPMWNFGIPYKLKHFLDIVIQPNYTFEITNSGYNGLLKNKKAVIIYARGGDYGDNNPLDMQKSYFELALGFMGIKDIHSILVEPTVHSQQEKIKIILKKAEDSAAALAVDF